MAKISPVSIKYMIYANLEAEGTLEKPDVIGAIFGQTEGLLGSELEMRELQKEGKIGRIEVELKVENGKTVGKIQIPSALDKEETTLIAAAMETIERVGPSNAKIQVDKIEDVRGNKRDYILERAKNLLEGMEEKMPRTREMAKTIKTESRVARLKEYGEEKLPAGDLSSEQIVVVEGRADVINLLRNGINNVIGMDGTKLPETIKELSYEKEITLFVDGDRGGKLITKNVMDNARIDYIAFAPDGKEVEELTGKEIFSSLRKRISAHEFTKKKRGISLEETSKIQKEKKENYFRQEKETLREEKEVIKEKVEREEGKMPEEKRKEKLKNFLREVENTKSALLLDEKLEVIDKVALRSLFPVLNRIKEVSIIVVDKATPNIIKMAEMANVESIVARNFASGSGKVELISL